MNTITISNFLGINNRLPDFALATEKGRWLRSADNVEITNSGHIVRRKALELVQSMTGAHSLHNDLLVRGGMLYKITLPTYSETLIKVLTSDDRMSYVDFNGYTYYSNGTDTGKVDSSGTWFPMALPTPDYPASVEITGGSLFAGFYQIYVSYVNVTTQEEGGLSPTGLIQVLENSGVRVTLPAAVPGATHINVYITTVNGAVSFLQSTVAVGTATIDLMEVSLSGRRANVRFEEPLPAGARLFLFNGRLCSVSGDTLYYGLPYRPGYYVPVSSSSPEGGYIAFPESISIAVGNQFGCYIVADKTYWLQGQELNTIEAVRTILPSRAVFGTEFAVPGSTSVGWFGENGIVIADNQGQAVEITSDVVDVDISGISSGVSVVLQTRGYNRVISCGYCVNLETKALATFSDWPVTSYSGDYCTADDGVYALEADGKVDANFDFGKENFGSPQLKHYIACYFGVSSIEPLMLRLALPTGEYYEYETRSSGEALETQRVDLGRGIRTTWISPSVYNYNGCDFTVATTAFAVSESPRRI